METTHITTFYSYKGGVGRTMLLANVGVILAQRGRKVLLWDLDLEAPGMQNIPDLKPSGHETGFLEWLLDLQTRRNLSDADREDLDSLLTIIQPVPDIDNLSILPAYGENADSAALYQDIDWHEFLVVHPDRGLNLFRAILDYFVRLGEFDHILLDARTGITDLGGVMTVLLPHATVLVGSYGAQNLSGLLQIYQALQFAVDGKVKERTDPIHLSRLMVISPVPLGQEERRNSRKAVWDREFSIDDTDRPMETRTEIPFDDRLLFIEDLLALSDPGSSVGKAYKKVAQKVDGLREELIHVRERIASEERAYPTGAGVGEEYFSARKNRIFRNRMDRLLSLLEYDVETDTIVDDVRVDLLARKKAGLRTESFLVECNELNKPIENELLVKLLARLDEKEAKAMRAEGMIVGRSFSPEALAAADANRVLCFTPEDLEKKLFDPEPYLARLRREFEESVLFHTYVYQRVLLENHPEETTGVDLLTHAMSWARGEGNRLWLLLGDYGAGKTSFFRRFSYELANEAQTTGGPIPIAVDLKEYPNAISLESLLQEHMRTTANWHGNPDILLHLLNEGRAILLLDAFDEMGAAAMGGKIEDQFRQLVKSAANVDNIKGNRILVTCRAHFFKDLPYVKDMSHVKADRPLSRDTDLGRTARTFNASIDELMLFNDEQIHRFLHKHLSKTQARQAKKFIRNTYDLTSLAPRPVLLEMIIKSHSDLLDANNVSTPAELYHVYTAQWIKDRSGASFHTSPTWRKRILEYLAFDLFGRSGHRIHHRNLVSVLKKMDSRRLAGVDFDRVDLELKTAPFLTRTNDGHYSFSHKSFREFFYSLYLLDAIEHGPGELAAALDTAPLTSECVVFLSDLIHPPSNKQEEESQVLQNLIASIQTILAAPYHRGKSENALRLAYEWSKNKYKNLLPFNGQTDGSIDYFMKPFIPEHAQLQDADLRKIDLAGAWLAGADFEGAILEESDLSMVEASGASFRNADMGKARLEKAVCRRTDFSNAILREADARGGNFSDSILKNSDLTASVFVNAVCKSVLFKNTNCHAVRFAGADLTDADWQDAISTRVTALSAIGNLPEVRPLPEYPKPFLQLGHTGVVHFAVFSHNGAMVLTAGEDRTARIWDVASGEEIHILKGHSSDVVSAVFSRNDSMVLTASKDGTARVWDTASGRELRLFKGLENWLNTAVFSKDQKWVLTAEGTAARILDAASDDEIQRFEDHNDLVNSAVFSGDDKWVLTAGNDGSARLWDSVSGSEIQRFEGHDDTVTSAVFSRDDKRIMTAGYDGSVRLWDTAAGEEIKRFTGHEFWVLQAVFSNDDTWALTTSYDRTSRIWDISRGKEIKNIQSQSLGVNSSVFSNDGSRILTAHDDQAARLRSFEGEEIKTFKTHVACVNFAVFSKSGERILTATGDGVMYLWDASCCKMIKIVRAHEAGITSAEFSKNEEIVLTAGLDGTARLWDMETGRQVLLIKGHDSGVASAVFSGDEKRILTASLDETARIWDASDGKLIRAFRGHDDWVRSAVFSRDCALILTAGSDHTARVWNADNGNLITLLRGHDSGVTSAVFSKDANRILTAGLDGVVRLWKAAEGDEIETFEGHTPGVTRAIFSNDDSQVLSAGSDQIALLWDAASAVETKKFEGHEGGVNSAMFSNNQRLIATASADGATRLWDSSTGDLLTTLISSPDGWLSLDARGFYRGEGDCLDCLSYFDPNDKTDMRTLWKARDVPSMAGGGYAPDEPEQ